MTSHAFPWAGGALSLAMWAATLSSGLSAAERGYVSLAGEKTIALVEIDEERAELAETGRWVVEGEPGALAVDPARRRLFASIRAAGRLASYRIGDQDQLIKISSTNGGADPAYVAVDPTGAFLLSAYYAAGKVTVHRVDEQGRLSEQPWQSEVTANKAHAIVFQPGASQVLVPHTGPNQIFLFGWGKGRLTDPQIVNTAAGSGPRHIAFHARYPRQAFVVNEQGSSVSRFLVQENSLLLRETRSTLPQKYPDRNACADIEFSPDGRWLIASNRGHNSLAVFRLGKQGELRREALVPTEAVPRSFNISPSGRWLIAAGQGSNTLALYQLSDSGLTRKDSLEIGQRPWWVQFVPQQPPAK